MKLKDIVFLEDYYFGKKQPFNCIDYSKLDYVDGNDFYKHQLNYIKRFQDIQNKNPQTYQTNISEFQNKHKTISTYEFLKNPNKDIVYFYPITIYSSPANSFEEDIVFNKIHYKILTELQYNDNLFLIINVSSEGFLSYENFDNIHNWLLDNYIDFEKVFFIHSNYNIYEYADDYKIKCGKEDCINVIPYLWSIPFFHNKFKHNDFMNETLYKQDYKSENKKAFNLLIRAQKVHRTRLLCDLEYVGLLDNNIVSYDFNLYESYDDSVYYNQFEKIMDKNSDKFEKYWNQLNELRKNKPKRTIDYEDLKSVQGINMETDIPYKNSLFTIVAESFFYEEEKIGYISEKVLKPIIHKHPFVVLSTSGTLTWLKNMGFKTFSDTGFIDESYDAEVDANKRYSMVVNEIINLSNLPKEQQDTFLYNCKDILEHNYNHLKNFNINNYDENLLWNFTKIRKKSLWE